MSLSAGARFLLAATLALIPTGAFADTAARKYYYEDIFSPFFVLDPARPGWYKSARPGSLESSFPAVKPAGSFRVFVLGGSIAGLLGERSSAGEFGKALRDVLPSRKVEVLNCGMAGYDSGREALIEQEILEYSPDLIVLLTGHNEGLASAPIPIWIMRAQERLSRYRAYRALVATLGSGEPQAAGSEERADARDAAFARTLGANIRHARERGVPVAVVVPPRNDREPAEVGLGMYDPQLVSGWSLYLRGDYAGARASWRRALTGDSPRLAFTEGLIARSEEKLGLWDEARDSFDRASRYDRSAICGARCRDILRAEAKKEGALLVEADAAFRALARPRTPGLEFFNDRMHWKPRFNGLVSSEIIAALRADPTLGALPWDAARVRALAASSAKPGGSSEDDDRRMLGYALAALSAPELTRISAISVFYLQALRANQPKWFVDVASLPRRAGKAQTGFAAPTAPDAVLLPRLYWHIGEARLLERDYRGASADISTALRLDPSLAAARLSLDVAAELSGAKPRGPERLSAAAPDPEPWLARAEAEAAAGRRAPSLAALERARASSPQPHQLRRIAQVYLRLREPAKFLELSDELSKLYPDDVDFWLARAGGSFLAGRKEAGLEALARAERLNPAPPQKKLLEGWRRWLAAGARPETAPL